MVATVTSRHDTAAPLLDTRPAEADPLEPTGDVAEPNAGDLAITRVAADTPLAELGGG